MPVVNVGFQEFLEENVKDLTSEMPWLKEKTLKCMDSIEELKTFIDKAINVGRCALDLETTSLNSRTRKVQDSKTGKTIKVPIEKIVGISLSYDPKEGIYIPVNHKEDAELNLPENIVYDEIGRLCKSCVTIYHNSKFDLSHLRNIGITLNSHTQFEDTQLLARLYDAGQKDVKLKHLSERLLGQNMIEFDQVCKDVGRFDLVSPKIGYIYAASDAICTLDLYNFFIEKDIIKEQKSVYNLEKRVVFVVMWMESNYIKIDTEYLQGMKVKTANRIKEIEKEIHQLAGREFNIGSTQQMGKLLFDELKYNYPLKTKTASGQYSTDDATLKKIAAQYPIVKRIIEFRGLQKVLTTYITNLLLNHDEEGCVKLGFHQSGTDTGRFSSPGGFGIDIDGYSGVNVQSIPKEVEGDEPDMRKAFISRPGKKFVAIDYENEEMRVATNLSKEKAWIEALNNGIDFHTATAAMIYNKDTKDVTKAERKVAKSVNFLCLFGGGARTLSENVRCSEAEARRVLTTFYAGVPKLKAWMNSEIAKARKVKSVKTAFNRVRPLKELYDSGDKILESKADRCTINTEIQGCLQKHERCLTNLGYLPIEEIFKLKKTRKDLKVWTGTSWEDFSVINRGPAQLAHIKLQNGMQLDTDTRHEVLTVGKDGYEFKHFKDLDENTLICVSMPRPMEFGEYPEKIHYKGNVHNASELRIETKEQWDFFAYFLGYITGDGSISIIEDRAHYCVALNFGKKKLNRNFDFLRKGLKKIGLTLPKAHLNKGAIGESYTSAIYSGALIKYLKEIGYIYKNAHDKRLVPLIFKAPLSMRKSFLKGYYDTDGSKTEGNKCGFHTPNKKLLQDVQLLGWTLGCPSNIYDNCDDTYTLSWIDQWAIKNILDIEVRSKKRRYNGTSVNLPDFLRAPILDCIQKRYVKSSKDTAYVCKIRKGKKVTLPGVLDLLKTYDCEIPLMYYHYKLKEKTILDQREDTYTLAVCSPLHRFDSAGIISKNTCADIMKTVMVRVYNWIMVNNLQEDIKILVTMHDELVFEIAEDKLDLYIPKIVNIMMLRDVLQGILQWPIVLTVDVKYGDTWRMKNKFFDDFPEAKKAIDEPVDFHFPNQITRYSIALNKPVQEPDIAGQVSTSDTELLKDPEASIGQKETSPTISVEDPVQENVLIPENVIKEAPKGENKNTEIDELISGIATENIPEISDNVFIYTLRQRSRSTLNRLNLILCFLTEENKRAIYKGPKKILQIRDSDKNCLLVSEIEVPIDGFLCLARFLAL